LVSNKTPAPRAESKTKTKQSKVRLRPGSPWWKYAVIYEIYPRSFQDSDGDGVGDLNGITARLDYLQQLGVDAIWLTPIYPSPLVDFGYDISDYENIDPQYGTLEDFDRLVEAARKRDIRVIVDMVLVHTSDQHPWFIESRSSRTNPKRDWYIWHDGKGEGKPPNNWQSEFGHSAWTLDEKTGQWYYHKFYVEQPDLNWRNPAVEKAMFDVVRFWLDRGAAGFRLDAIPTLFEDPQFRDAKEIGGTNAFGDPRLDDKYTDNLPEVHDVMRRLRAMVDTYPDDPVLIGETYLPDIAELDKWYGGARRDELHLPMDMLVGLTNKLDARLLRQRLFQIQTQIHGNQPLLVFDNHDNPRSWDRYGDGKHNHEIAKLLAAILFTSRSTALMYYGEEIGMVTTPPARKEDVKDPVGITGWPKEKGRDGERTPMQWDDTANAGFSPATPWLPVPASYSEVNVTRQQGQPGSLLEWHRQLIALRRANAALRDGAQVMLNVRDKNVLSYLRRAPGAAPVVIVLNLGGADEKVHFNLKPHGSSSTSAITLLASFDAPKQVSTDQITIPPFGAWIGEVLG
jgi:alpha-glucosidase